MILQSIYIYKSIQILSNRYKEQFHLSDDIFIGENVNIHVSNKEFFYGDIFPLNGVIFDGCRFSIVKNTSKMRRQKFRTHESENVNAHAKANT